MMLEGVNILTGDPSLVSSEQKDWWIGELQMRVLEASHDEDAVECFWLNRRFGATTMEARILRRLSSGGAVSSKALSAISLTNMIEQYENLDVYGAPKNVAVWICRLRARLKPFGLKINTVRAFGFECPPETCEILKSVMVGEPVKSPQIGA